MMCFVLCLQTHTIVQALRVMLAQRQAGVRGSHPILVCAETHTAVDNIMIKLLATNPTAGSNCPAGGAKLSKEDVLRIGDMSRVAPELKR